MIRRVLTYLGVLFGIVAFSGLFMVLFGNSIELSCSRNGRTVTCQIDRKFLGRYPVSRETVEDVADVQLQEDCDEGCSYRAVLITSDGRAVPVNAVYTDGGPVGRQVGSIKSFLAGGQPRLDLEIPVAWWALLLAGGFGTAGLFGLIASFLSQSRRG